MKRWHMESILSHRAEDPEPSPLVVMLIGFAMLLAPIAIGAAFCAGWFE